MIDGTFDPSRYQWEEVTGRPGSKSKIHHDYTILGMTVTPAPWTW